MVTNELKVKIFNSVLILFFIFTILYIGNVKYKEEETTTTKTIKSPVIKIKKVTPIKDTLNFKQHLLLYMDSINLKYPKVVLAQAILESNHFKSNVFFKYNNLFGMKIPSRRPSLNIHSKSYTTTYSSYKSWKESVIDYALFQSTFIFKINSEEEYLDYISKNYTNKAYDKVYKNKLQKIMANI